MKSTKMFGNNAAGFARVQAWRKCCREAGIPESLTATALPTFESANLLEDEGHDMEAVWTAFEPHATRIVEASQKATQAKRSADAANAGFTPETPNVCGEWDPSLAIKVGDMWYPRYMVQWGLLAEGEFTDVSELSEADRKHLGLEGRRLPVALEFKGVAEFLSYGNLEQHVASQRGKPSHIARLEGGDVAVMNSYMGAILFNTGEDVTQVGRYVEVHPL
jgi:hypothetical protein